jgi:RNA polymerase sigma-70 factor (ECF subfamily)
LSDSILVKRAKDGDRKALEALCVRHQPTVEKLARRILRDPEEARDAAQDSPARRSARVFWSFRRRRLVSSC